MGKKNTLGVVPFNPLDKKNLGASVAKALLLQPAENMPPERFSGAGIYAIYYKGSFGLYKKLGSINREGMFEIPIYVGKAVSEGARKGASNLDDITSKALCSRLFEHTSSIADSENLDLRDFYCRYLVVDDIWIPLAESLLVSHFSPLWNKIIDGFGNHNPGKGRYKQQKSPWDTLHPGRAWADKLEPLNFSIEKLKKNITSHLDGIRLSTDFEI